jgi:glycosyltransferase involved in cell wall biosynthesis
MPVPLVAVGLAVYNSERYVSQSIDCLLAQSFKDFALFISDNASTDRTSEICQRYAARDSRIRYTKNPVNIGMVGNYNLLFSYCRSKYFRWATADDYWHEDMLKDAVQVMEADPSLSLCYPRAKIVDQDGREMSLWQDCLHLMQEDPAERFLAVVQNIGRVHHHLGLMRADIMRRTRLLARHVSSDIGFVAEMSLYGKFSQIPKYQMYRRVHEDSSSVGLDNPEHMRRRYHAANTRRVPFNRLSMHRVLFSAVLRSPLSLPRKVTLVERLARFMYWDRGRLLHETAADMLSVVRRLAG